MTLIVGNFRHKKVVYSTSVTKNSYGEDVIKWTVSHTLKAEKKSLSGSKNIDKDEIFTSNNLQFITHYRNIDETMIITYDNNNYLINSIEEIGYREGLKITVEKMNE